MSPGRGTTTLRDARIAIAAQDAHKGSPSETTGWAEAHAGRPKASGCLPGGVNRHRAGTGRPAVLNAGLCARTVINLFEGYTCNRLISDVLRTSCGLSADSNDCLPRGLNCTSGQVRRRDARSSRSGTAIWGSPGDLLEDFEKVAIGMSSGAGYAELAGAVGRDVGRGRMVGDGPGFRGGCGGSQLGV